MKKMKLRIMRFLSFTFTIIFLICVCDIGMAEASTKEEYISQQITVTRPAKIKKQDITEKNYCTLHCGEKMQLTVKGKSATNWKSSDPKVVKVNSKGVVTACNIKNDNPEDAYKGVMVSCKKNGITYKCYVTNGKLSLNPFRYYYKDEQSTSVYLYGLAGGDGPKEKGFKLYDKNDWMVREYNSFREKVVKTGMGKTSSTSIVKIARSDSGMWELSMKKPGTARITVSFTTYAGYQYVISKKITYLSQTYKDAEDELWDNVEDYYTQWKAENMVLYTEEEVGVRLKEIVKDFPEGEYFTKSKYYEKEWKEYGEGSVLSYSPQAFSYTFAGMINSAVFGTRHCVIGRTDTGKLDYITEDGKASYLIGGGPDDGYAPGYPQYSQGYANGCSGFSKNMDHFSNDFERIRIGDIVVIHAGSTKSRAGIVLSKTDEAIHVIFSNKTTYYKDWTRKTLERDDFIVITRYE